MPAVDAVERCSSSARRAPRGRAPPARVDVGRQLLHLAAQLLRVDVDGRDVAHFEPATDRHRTGRAHFVPLVERFEGFPFEGFALGRERLTEFVATPTAADVGAFERFARFEGGAKSTPTKSRRSGA